MTLQDALNLYKIPYMVTQTTTGGGFTSYKITPTGSTATRQRLKTRLLDLQDATGERLEIVEADNGLYIRSRGTQTTYQWKDYNGYIDFTSPDCPFLVGFSNGQLITDSLENSRHLLISGTTGSGKSVFLHNLIATFACNPNNYLYLVDCKQVEFSIYKDVALVATEIKGEVSALRFASSLVDKMEERFRQMDEDGVNNFTDFQKLHPQERRHILVIDELADLISDRQSANVLIPQVLRLAQKGRAAGVHVILATQRPDSTIINGTLKGNIPTRVSFRTISAIDSRIILDQTGAEKLNGNGDGLYLRNGAFNLTRFQSPYISLDDIRQLQTA